MLYVQADEKSSSWFLFITFKTTLLLSTIASKVLCFYSKSQLIKSSLCHNFTMDPIKLEKIKAINKYKKHQLQNNLFLYSLTAITCSLFCSSPLWFPSLMAFLYANAPKFWSIFYNSKFVFIAGNLIVVALIGESKIFSYSSPAIEDYYEQYVSSSRKLQQSLAPQVMKDKVLKKMTWKEERVEVDRKELKGLDAEDDDDGGELCLPTEELNKRADDYIAKVNKQRIFEATQLLCDGEFRVTKPDKYQRARR